MTKWFHVCDLDWLKTRQKCLTATDVKDLLPVTRTGRKRTIDDEDYLKVMARKLVNLTPDDCVSVGAAARGHVLEPYAIQMFNDNLDSMMDCYELYHWDDFVIGKKNRQVFGLAFSPDAMNISMSQQLYAVNEDGTLKMDNKNPVSIGEVKSYSPERHMVCAYTDPQDLEERWQLATAMAVCDTIDVAHLLFYNPSMRNQLYVVTYDRVDLEQEIEIVKQVETDWLSWLSNLGKLDHGQLFTGSIDREQSIIDQIIKQEELNPDNMKSVIR